MTNDEKLNSFKVIMDAVSTYCAAACELEYEAIHDEEVLVELRVAAMTEHKKLADLVATAVGLPTTPGPGDVVL